jgi:flagellar biosynthesis protein FliR
MSLKIDMAWLIATLLLSVRIACATVFAPVFGPSQIPASARVLFTMALSAFVVSSSVALAPAELSLPALLIAMLAEATLGLAFAFGFIAAYSATQLAGRVLDVQIGFGAASVLNPATQIASPLLGSVFGMAAIAVFLAMDGHLVLVRALAESARTFPPGAAWNPLRNPAALLEHSAVVFGFALAICGPIMFMFLLSDLAMGVFARSMPQLNVFVLGFAIKIVLGLIGLAMSIRFADGILGDLFGRTFGFWEAVATDR